MAIKVFTRTLSSAEVLNLFASSIVIFPAPAAAPALPSVNAIIGVSFRLIYNSIPYAGGVTYFGIFNSNQLYFQDTAVFLSSANSEATLRKLNARQCILLSTLDLSLSANGAIINGNSQLEVKITYENIIYHT